MFYYEVIVNSVSYQGKEPLTYECEQLLNTGALVSVSLKTTVVLAVVVKRVKKPRFSTKAVAVAFDVPLLPAPLIDMAKWLAAYYPAGLGSIGQQFLPKSLPAKLEVPNTNKSATKPIELEPLTTEQLQVLKQIDQPDTYTLHGETGSGKTRVYIELAQRALSKKQSALILTPEIALTPQLAQNFARTFGDRVLITHSRMGEGARRKIWLQILRATEPLVVIGPRSALFSPLKNIGLIIIDESHETSYKQEQSPHYQATKVAAKLASLHGATLVLGSATPSINDYFLATEKQKPILRMEKLARDTSFSPPGVQIVDLRDRSNFTQKPHLSDALLHAVEQALRKGEQSLLFLNRRGTARVILCSACGWQAVCPHCNLPLTYHGDSHNMRCHTCGYTQVAITSCPICGNTEISLKSIGTKAIVDEIAIIFPDARIRRFDNDNKKADRIEEQYDAIRAGEVDILVGTQTLAKGLDLPKLSVVGVIVADSSLYLPDYTATERTYQIIRQVIGRVGRGHRDSSVIVQTYDPENLALQTATQNDWERFYAHELSERKKFNFPPYCHLLRLTCRRASTTSARTAATKLAKDIRDKPLRVTVDGPSPSLHEKIGEKYEWQLVLKAKRRDELLAAIANLPSGWSYDIDPINLL